MSSSFKQLLVHLDASRRSGVRLRIARELARQHGAALSVLYAATPSFVALPYTPEISPSLASTLLAIDEERRARARATFEEGPDGPGAGGLWGELAEPPVIGAFAQQALYADLLVLGQHDPSDTEAAAVPADFAESVLVVSGKPALIIPYAGEPASLGQTVVIAWKETREAARAVAAAMPLLQRAARIHVLSWDGVEADEPAVPPGAGAMLDLDSYLRAHGLQATWHRGGQAPDEVGEIILSRAFDLGADLLVMGCYGHSRAREWVLGGTSRTVLRAMTLPVLMSH